MVPSKLELIDLDLERMGFGKMSMQAKYIKTKITSSKKSAFLDQMKKQISKIKICTVKWSCDTTYLGINMKTLRTVKIINKHSSKIIK